MNKIKLIILPLLLAYGLALGQSPSSVYYSECNLFPPGPFNPCVDCQVTHQDDGTWLVHDCPVVTAQTLQINGKAITVHTTKKPTFSPMLVPDPTDTNQWSTNISSTIPTNGLWLYVTGFQCPGNDYTGGTNHPKNLNPVQWALTDTNGVMQSWDNWGSWVRVDSFPKLTVWWHDACTNHVGAWPAFQLVSVAEITNTWVTNVTTFYMTNGQKVVSLKPLLIDTNGLCYYCMTNAMQGVPACDPTNLNGCWPGWTNNCTNPSDTNCSPPIPSMIATPIWDSDRDWSLWYDIRYPPSPWNRPTYPWSGTPFPRPDPPSVVDFPKFGSGKVQVRGQPGTTWLVECATNIGSGATWTTVSTNWTFSAEGTNAPFIDTSNLVYVLGLTTNDFLNTAFFRLRKP